VVLSRETGEGDDGGRIPWIGSLCCCTLQARRTDPSGEQFLCRFGNFTQKLCSQDGREPRKMDASTGDGAQTLGTNCGRGVIGAEARHSRIAQACALLSGLAGRRKRNHRPKVCTEFRLTPAQLYSKSRQVLIA